MNLSEALKKKYTKEKMSAFDAQRLAEFIAFGPVVFQASRLMIKFGILDLLNDHSQGMTCEELVEATGLSDYAVKCLTDASLSSGTILIDDETDKFKLSKTGYFLLHDPATRANIDFNHDVNYRGWFYLEEALKEGRPAGLKTLGDWPTIYEGLSSLEPQVQKSWFGFDHFYSDSSFPEAMYQMTYKNSEKGKKLKICMNKYFFSFYFVSSRILWASKAFSFSFLICCAVSSKGS